MVKEETRHSLLLLIDIKESSSLLLLVYYYHVLLGEIITNQSYFLGLSIKFKMKNIRWLQIQ
ncbi:MAG: hypothetical protein ACRD8K_11785 [Nitrososphaeraceae archaeon]